MKIYLASSDAQPTVLAALRAAGHEAYDFRNPAPGEEGFSWSGRHSSIRRSMSSPASSDAEHCYDLDISALRGCEVCVLLLPSGRSASWEFGYAMGQGKQGIVLQMGKVEPELMYREAEIASSIDELLLVLNLLDRNGVRSNDDLIRRLRLEADTDRLVGSPDVAGLLLEAADRLEAHLNEHDVRAKARETCLRLGLSPESEDIIMEVFKIGWNLDSAQSLEPPLWARPGMKVRIHHPGYQDDGSSGTVKGGNAEGCWIRDVYTEPCWYPWSQIKPYKEGPDP